MRESFINVYILTSLSKPNRHYTGLTNKLANRLAAHNAGTVPFTAPAGPRQIETSIAFRNREKAAAFEKYLKSHSGWAFAAKWF